MADLPITFSGPMVQALLREIKRPGTGKRQTRRTLKPQPPEGARYSGIHYASDEPDSFFFNSPNGPRKVRPRIEEGDRLYVREHWRCEAVYDDTPPRDISFDACMVRYEADGSWSDHDAMTHAGRFRQAMHMPRWASRITLLVTDVRVERLQGCSKADAIAEGIDLVDAGPGFTGNFWRDYQVQYNCWSDPRDSFRTLWDSINGEGAWEVNPWVAIYEFRPVLGNIDQIAEAA